MEEPTSASRPASKCELDHRNYNGRVDPESQDHPASSISVAPESMEPGFPLPNSTYRLPSSKVEGLYIPDLIAKVIISPEFVNSNSLETVLISTKNYSELTFGCEIGDELKPERDSHGSYAVYDRIDTRRNWRCTEYVWSKFHRGLSLLEENKFQDGYKSLHQGCQLVQSFIGRQSRQCLSSLFIHMGNHRWLRHAKVRQSLLRFLFGMSSTMLGSKHPLSIILSTISRDHDLINDYAELALKVMLDATSSHGDATHVELLRIRMCLSVVLSRQKEDTKSEVLIESTCYQSEQRTGTASAETRQCLRRLANLRACQGRLQEAETIFEDVLRRQLPILKSNPTDELSIYTYRNLALLCAKRGDTAKSNYWFKKELDAALLTWGPQDEYYNDCRSMQNSRVQGNAPGLLGMNWPEIT